MEHGVFYGVLKSAMQTYCNSRSTLYSFKEVHDGRKLKIVASDTGNEICHIMFDDELKDIVNIHQHAGDAASVLKSVLGFYVPERYNEI